jgi:hypothetical protein
LWSCSDKDNFTNGWELYDPCGVWQPGQPLPGTSDISHPGNRTSQPQVRVPMNLTAACGTNPCASAAARAGMATVLRKRLATVTKHPLLLQHGEELFTPEEAQILADFDASPKGSADSANGERDAAPAVPADGTHAAYAARLRSRTRLGKARPAGARA